MKRLTVDAVLGTTLDVDVCSSCRAFWFDPFETLHLTPASTLALIGLIAEARDGAGPIPIALRCPKCRGPLKHCHDRQHNTPFEYWRCEHEHGRFTRFNDFLKEKNFIQPLSPTQIAELRKKVRMINCSNCGAPVDLVHESACGHCGAPLVMLDREAMAELANRYRAAADRPRPTLPSPPPASPDSFNLGDLARWLLDLLR
jgi:uncharacterized protein YbaR (Trm112 family)